MGRKKIILISLLFFGVFSACTQAHNHQPEYRTQPEASGNNLSLEALTANPQMIQFADVERLVFKKNCTGCHNPIQKKDRVDLTSYLSLTGKSPSKTKNVVKAYTPHESPVFSVLVAAGERHMPPRKKTQLSKEQINLVYYWIEQGAKEIASSKTERPPTIEEDLQPYFDHPEKVDYKVVNEKVFTPYCVKCHSREGEKFDPEALQYGVDLTNYEGLFNPFGPGAVIGDPFESKIYKAIAIEQTMPNVGKGYKLLNPYLSQLVRVWILNCAVEDVSKLVDDQITPKKDDNEYKVRLCPGQ